MHLSQGCERGRETEGLIPTCSIVVGQVVLPHQAAPVPLPLPSQSWFHQLWTCLDWHMQVGPQPLAHSPPPSLPSSCLSSLGAYVSLSEMISSLASFQLLPCRHRQKVNLSLKV